MISICRYPDGNIYHYSKSGLEKGIVIEGMTKMRKEKYYYIETRNELSAGISMGTEYCENSILKDDNLDYLNTTLLVCYRI